MRALLVSPGTVSLRYSHWLKHDVCSVHCVERMREGGIEPPQDKPTGS
jgi:hypothetical protein